LTSSPALVDSIDIAYRDQRTPPPEAEQGRSAPTAFAYTTACADATQKHTVRVLG
jgi:hypothetical protein